MTQELGPLARKLSLPYYDNALPAHDRFHANRVRDVSIRLANKWDRTVDSGVLSAAAWLHDIGRPRERTGEVEDHGKWAAVKAEDLLGTEGVTTDQINAIKHCLQTHSIRSSSPEPETPEAKLLFDADKLDATGARGLIRLACIIGERSGRTSEKHAVIDTSSVPEMEQPDRPDITLIRKWAKERLDALYTPPGCRLGQSRWNFMEEFFTQFNSEMSIEEEK